MTRKLPSTFYSLSSYWFAIQCFFGHAGCNYLPGLRGTAFIVMYVISYVGSGLLIRYDEGATYLAVVQVNTCRAAACVTSHKYIVLILSITLYNYGVQNVLSMQALNLYVPIYIS